MAGRRSAGAAGDPRAAGGPAQAGTRLGDRRPRAGGDERPLPLPPGRDHGPGRPPGHLRRHQCRQARPRVHPRRPRHPARPRTPDAAHPGDGGHVHTHATTPPAGGQRRPHRPSWPDQASHLDLRRAGPGPLRLPRARPLGGRHEGHHRGARPRPPAALPALAPLAADPARAGRPGPTGTGRWGRWPEPGRPGMARRRISSSWLRAVICWANRVAWMPWKRPSSQPTSWAWATRSSASLGVSSPTKGWATRPSSWARSGERLSDSSRTEMS